MRKTQIKYIIRDKKKKQEYNKFALKTSNLNSLTNKTCVIIIIN